MNNLLQSGYSLLSDQEKKELRHRLADSPRALTLLDFLEERAGKKFNTLEVVRRVYADQPGDFSVLRNRFFKLRKHVISVLRNDGNFHAGGISLLPLEEELFRCRQLIAANHFNQVIRQLKQLIAECRRLNIFELLPEAYNQYIYANLALNNLKDQERHLKALEESGKLFDDLRSMQALSRRAYLAAISRNTPEFEKYLRSMKRIVNKRSAYPRFSLIYHFIVMTNAPALPGYSGKGHARHLSALKKIMAKYPEMPSGTYEAHASSLMQYYILIADGSHEFMRGDVHTCYKLFTQAWEIQERIPNLRIRKSESNFKNKIAIEVATGRFREAVKTAYELVEFHKEHKLEEKRLNGYAELAVVYSYAFPSIRCPDPVFLTARLKSYSALLRREKSFLVADVECTRAIFAFMNRDWKTANRIMESDAVRKVFSSMNLDVYNEILVLSPVVSPEMMSELRKKIRTLMEKAVSSDRVFSLKRALHLLTLLGSQG